MGRILGIDFGSRRVGLALSDPGHTVASPWRTIRYLSLADLIENLASLVKERDVERIVVGLPLSMKGQETSQTHSAMKFMAELQRHVPVSVDSVDERLTSVEAERILVKQGLKPSRNRDLIDATAASILLQSYLDRERPRDPANPR